MVALSYHKAKFLFKTFDYIQVKKGGIIFGIIVDQIDAL